MNAVREVDPDIIAVSYRLTPENAALLTSPIIGGCATAIDAVVCAVSYVYAHIAKKMGVRDYITTYMFETPPHLSIGQGLRGQCHLFECSDKGTNWI